MARVARFKIQNNDAWYHLYSRIAGLRGHYPLSEAAITRKLIDTIEHFTSIYFCEVAAFTVLGNHYHLVARFEAPWPVEEDELRARARLMYPSKTSQRQIDEWSRKDWDHFRQRLFDVSELMRNIQSAFARWYNRNNNRRGRFWADRFKSVYLENEAAVLDCMLYVELNPVRAGLVERPEDWRGSSIFLRDIGKADWLMPLSEILAQPCEEKALIEFRERLYHRGSVPTKQGQASISQAVLDQEAARGFANRGVYRKRLAYFVDGLAVGTEQFLRDQITRMRENGQYLRRRNPIPQLGGVHLSLREQRSTSIVP
jgi:REP element-mobilizing transposase RayT